MKHFIGLFCLLSFANAALAADLEGCAAVQVTDSHGAIFQLWQHQFEGGGRDLAMSPPQTDIKRITYENAGECRYQALALTEGAGWGWHMAWADAQHVYYARMDGEAWVSSVPKKFAAQNASNLQFLQNGTMLKLSWQAAGAQFSMQSSDEGRSWD